MSDENEHEDEPETPAATETERPSPYLHRAKMLLVEGVVYCLEHTAVHDDTTDPYGYGTPDCKEKEHRPVYYRARKGDIDESVAHAQVGPTARVITHDQDDGLSDEERTLTARLVSRELSRAESAFAEMREIIGVGDLSATEETMELLASAARKLQGHG
jgi:hypothetical protein